MSKATYREMRLFRALFVSLWGRKFNETIHLSPHSALYNQYPPIASEAALGAHLPHEKKIAGDFKSNYLWLIPSIHGDKVYPVLHLKYDFSRHIPEVKLRLALFLHYDGDCKAIGFRFESPEGKGRHHFYHVQMIRGFGKDENFGRGCCPEWLPMKEPTFLLPAVDSISLVLYLISCVYGIEDATETLRNAAHGDKEAFERYSKSLKPQEFDELLWYWKASPRASGKEKFIETDLQPDEFQSKFCKASPGHSLSQATPEDYEKAKPKDRMRWPRK